MNTRIDEIVVKMGLSQYQANVLRSHPDIYVLSRLVKRGCVLYAPRATHGFYNFIQRLIMGRRGDLIGYDKCWFIINMESNCFWMVFTVRQLGALNIMPMIKATLLRAIVCGVIKIYHDCVQNRAYMLGQNLSLFPTVNMNVCHQG